MRMNYVPKHSLQHADYSECVSHAGVDRKAAKFIGNKQINIHAYKQTFNFIY